MPIPAMTATSYRPAEMRAASRRPSSASTYVARRSSCTSTVRREGTKPRSVAPGANVSCGASASAAVVFVSACGAAASDVMLPGCAAVSAGVPDRGMGPDPVELRRFHFASRVRWWTCFGYSRAAAIASGASIAARATAQPIPTIKRNAKSCECRTDHNTRRDLIVYLRVRQSNADSQRFSDGRQAVGNGQITAVGRLAGRRVDVGCVSTRDDAPHDAALEPLADHQGHRKRSEETATVQ